jgi:N utilization substance protein B
MSQTDLNVLRLAATELLHVQEVPAHVTVEMAVRMAKTFGGEDSGRFVNAVASKLADARAEDPTEEVEV